MAHAWLDLAAGGKKNYGVAIGFLYKAGVDLQPGLIWYNGALAAVGFLKNYTPRLYFAAIGFCKQPGLIWYNGALAAAGF